MSAEPKVLLEFRTRRGEMRITADHYVDEREGEGWKTLTPHHDPIDIAIAVYDALEARHARVREAAEAASKALTMAVHALRSYQHFNSSTDLAKSAADHCEPVLSALRAALEDKA